MTIQQQEIHQLRAAGSLHFSSVETTSLIDDLIARNAPVAVGISGGKDSDVAAFETQAYMRERGHKGPLILIHSDLGRVEHKDSLPACWRLSDRLGLELVVVRREKGDMMDRWLQRWNDNLERYRNLLCVKLILPWSTASMRFCTSEMKTAICCRDLVARYPGQTILSVSGIRRQESVTRAKAQVCEPQTKLTSKTFQTTGYNWNPILAWTLEEVFAYHQHQGFSLHEAYGRGLSRVSCVFCILSSLPDLIASATNPDHHDLYREQVDLEIVSGFSFQSERWLGDIAPHLLSEAQQAGMRSAKRKAAERERIEAPIPDHLLYKRGWPTVMPTRSEAILLSEGRRAIADLYELVIAYSDPDAILDRYAELIHLRDQRGVAMKPVMVQPVQQQLWNP